MKFKSPKEILFPPPDQMVGVGETRPKGFPGPECSSHQRTEDTGGATIPQPILGTPVFLGQCSLSFSCFYLLFSWLPMNKEKVRLSSPELTRVKVINSSSPKQLIDDKGLAWAILGQMTRPWQFLGIRERGKRYPVGDRCNKSVKV